MNESTNSEARAASEQLKREIETIGRTICGPGALDGVLIVGVRRCDQLSTPDALVVASAAVCVSADRVAADADSIEEVIHAHAIDAMATRMAEKALGRFSTGGNRGQE